MSSSSNSKLDAIIAAYVEAIERGEKPDRQQLIADHPEQAEELARFFADFDKMQATHLQIAPESDATVIPQHEPKHGTLIGGRYKLRENIGEGGMGSVWVAEQLHPVKRKVAIKLVKAGMDSKQVLARFEAERQALAVMDHPNIAKVFDGGMTENGRPYFVMEYVKGVPFTEYCDKARLSLKERLNLFIPVCQAVQHAHHKGIVHRDLKPSNILICLYDGKPVPKVIDFGLAKAMNQSLTEHSIFTGHGVMVGTPLYMSPEQAEHNNLDVDTRTDIYSLGVVLYELLTGTTPLQREQLRTAAYNEILRLIKEVEPLRPSTRLSGSASLPSVAAQRSIDPRHLQKSLAGDLDWIVMKSLEKDRSRRYETATGLARDVECFLADEAVEACPPSLAYRVRKFTRRCKAQVVAASLIFATLIVGLIGTAWGLRQARLAEARTIVALVQVTQERNAKEIERKNAEAARLRSEVAEKQTLESYRDSTDDTIRELIGSKENIGPMEKAYLEKTLARWQVFANQQGDDVRSREIRAEGYHRVAYLYHHLGQADRARTAYELAHQVLEGLTREFPDDLSKLFSFAECRVNLAIVLNELGESNAAKTECEAAKLMFFTLFCTFPDDPKFRAQFAESYSVLGKICLDSGDGGGALAYFHSALLHAEELVKQHPSDLSFQFRLANCHNCLGVFQLQTGNSDAALREFEPAARILYRLCEERPYDTEYHLILGGIYCNQGNSYLATSDPESSLDYYRKAIDLISQTFASQPQNMEARTFLRNSHRGRAVALVTLQRQADSLADWDNAVTLSPPGIQSELRSNRVLAQCQAGQFEAAVTEAATLIRLAETEHTVKLSPDNWYRFACCFSVASDKSSEKQVEYANRAMELLRKAVTAGYNTPEAAAHIAQDSDIDPLRVRSDFKQLLESLPKAPGPAGDPAPSETAAPDQN